MRFDIQKKIILISAVIFFLTFGAGTWVNGIYFNAEYSTALKSQAFVISQTLHSQLNRLLKMRIPIHQMEGFDEMCKEVLADHPFLSYAMVVDTQGKIIFHNDSSKHGQQITNPAVLEGIAGISQSVRNLHAEGNEYYDFFIPVFAGDSEHIATIRTGFPSSVISEKTKKMTLYSFGITALFITIGILLLIILLHLWVGRPTQRFIGTIKHLSRNWTDSSRQAEVTSDDEIGQLADAFNQMTDTLRETTVSKEYMNNIISNMLNCLIILDTDMTVQSVNRAAVNLLEYREDELFGKHLGTVVLSSSEMEKIKKDSVNELTLRSKSGRDIPVLFSSSILREGGQSISGFICVAQDITRLKKAENEKIKAQAVANENKKLALIGQVAGKMAHDFNNILSGIMGLSELSLMDCKDKETARTFDIIFKQTLRGKNLTKNLVAFAKSQEPKYEFFHVNEKIDLVIDLMKKDLEGIPIVLETDPDLPELLADPGMIEHAMMNIVQNSIHAVSKTEEPVIAIRTFSKDGKVCIEIEDNGCGIPEKHLENIFDPSFTLKGSRDKLKAYKQSIKGTGYGMSNVKKYITQHKGTISVTSNEGSGTKFSIKLPVTEKELSAVEKSALENERLCSNKHILVLEDEPSISEVQYKILTHKPCCHSVDVADTGQAAIDLLDKNHYDAASLDYIIPGDINGLDVYHHIRKTDPTLPVLFASGNIEFLESIEKMKHKDPYIEHLPKPCMNMDFINAVNTLILKKQHVKS